MWRPSAGSRWPLAAPGPRGEQAGLVRGRRKAVKGVEVIEQEVPSEELTKRLVLDFFEEVAFSLAQDRQNN